MRLPRPRVGRFTLTALVLVPMLVAFGLIRRDVANALAPSRLAGQDAIVAVGLPRLGEVAFEVAGRTDRGPQGSVMTGYLTALAGADDALLFSAPDQRTVDVARFTFVAELLRTTSAQVGGVGVDSAVGVLTIYVQPEPAGDFADPASFVSGEPIAVFDFQTQDIVTELPGGTRLVTTTGELSQGTATPFEHEGVTYRVGRPDAIFQINLTGAATDNAAPDLESFVYAGAAELTGIRNQGASVDSEPEDAPTPEETPEDAEEPTPLSAGDGCDLIEPWFAATSIQAEDIEVLAEFILDVDDVGELSGDQLRAAADALAVLAEEGRSVELPDEASEINAEIADATDALSEAVQAIATAVDDGDQNAFFEGQEDLIDALDDLLTALSDAETLAQDCEGE